MKLRVTAKLRRNADGRIELDYGRDTLPSHRFGPGGYEEDPEVQKGNWQELRRLKSQIIQKAYELIESWKLRGKKVKDLFTDPNLKQYSYKIRTEIEKYLNSLGMLQVFKEAYGDNISDWFHNGVIASTDRTAVSGQTGGVDYRTELPGSYKPQWGSFLAHIQKSPEIIQLGSSHVDKGVLSIQLKDHPGFDVRLEAAWFGYGDSDLDNLDDDEPQILTYLTVQGYVTVTNDPVGDSTWLGTIRHCGGRLRDLPKVANAVEAILETIQSMDYSSSDGTPLPFESGVKLRIS
jgi:hypothetical protein